MVYSALVASSKSLSASSIETSGNGSIYLIVQELTVDGGTTYTRNLHARHCWSERYEADSCISDGSWHRPRFDNDAGYGDEWKIAGGSESNALDTDVGFNGTIHVAFLNTTGCDSSADDCSLAEDYVYLAYLNSSGFSGTTNTTFLGDGSTSNSSLSFDLGLDDSVHLAFLNGSGGLHYSSCPSECFDPGSWSSEQLDPTYESGIIDIAIGPDISAVILVGATSGTFTLHKSEGEWSVTEVSSDGGSEWVGSEIGPMGKMWGFVYYPGSTQSLTLFLQEGMTNSGLLSDIDDDGWTRRDEARCGSNFRNGSIVPGDSDQDGVCDAYDGIAGETWASGSDALAVGEGFGCAVGAFTEVTPPNPSTNYSVVCWGDNSEGQLGTSLGGTESASGAVRTVRRFSSSSLSVSRRRQ